MTYNPSRSGSYTPTLWAGTTEATSATFTGTGTDTITWHRTGDIVTVSGALQFSNITDWGSYDAMVVEMPFPPYDDGSGADVSDAIVKPIFFTSWHVVGASSSVAGTLSRTFWGEGDVIKEAANDGRLWCYAVGEISDTDNLTFSTGLYLSGSGFSRLDFGFSYRAESGT